MHMSGICHIVAALLLLVAGLMLLFFGLGSMDSATAHLIGGAALALVGLGHLVHIMDACPLCKK